MADTDYKLLTAQLEGLIDAEPQAVPLLSNASALLNMMLPRLNWAGFYRSRGKSPASISKSGKASAELPYRKTGRSL